MKMLPQEYQFYAINNGGEDMTYDEGGRISVRVKPWKISSGNLLYGSVVTDDFTLSAGEVMSVAESLPTLAFDNSSDLNWGLHGVFQVTMDDDASTGSVDLYVEYTDEPGALPSSTTSPAVFDIETQLIFVTSIPIASDAESQTYAVNFEL